MKDKHKKSFLVAKKTFAGRIVVPHGQVVNGVTKVVQVIMLSFLFLFSFSFFFAPTHNTNIFSNLTISSGFFSSAKTKALSNQRPLGTNNKDWAYCNTWEDCEFYMPCFGGCAITRL